MVFQPASTVIQWPTCVCAAHATFSARKGACFLLNASSMAKVIMPLAVQSSMNAMLFCRMVRLLGRQSGCIGGASSPSSADCIRLRYKHGTAPGLVSRIVQIRSDDFGQRHRAVTDRFH